MKFLLVLLVAGVLATKIAMAAGSFYDLNQELKSADRLLYKGQYEDAIEILSDAVRSEPNNAEAWNLLGYASRKFGDLETSAEAYQKALSIDPEHKNALEYQGELFLMLNDKIAAQSNLEKLMALCPDGCKQLDSLKNAISAYP